MIAHGNTTGLVERVEFDGDWPGDLTSGVARDIAPQRTGVGPMRVDDLCPSCDGPISTTGECKCS